MEASSQVATLAIVACLGMEKILANLNCSLSDGIKALHWKCSSCCDVDVLGRSPPTTPTPRFSNPPSPQHMSNPLVVEPPTRI